MKKILYILITAALCFGCEFVIYDTPFPDSATVELTVKWEDLHENDTEPAEYIVLNNDVEQIVLESPSIYILDPKSSNKFWAYNQTSDLLFTDGIASLENLSANPGNLYYGYGTTKLIKDHVSKLTINTKKGTAPVNFTINYVPSELSNVTTVEVSLAGVATVLDMATGELMNADTLVQNPVLSDQVSQVEVDFNILGTVGELQELIFTFITVDGQTIVVTKDLSDLFEDFNSTMEGVEYTGDLSLPTDLDTEGTITDWVPGTGGTGTAQ